ncbi:hypothetical protein BDN70DRAFT_879204 [Pholiota conissans]|uniref:DUF7726 domain-containing protein n=1 Tax=Pholiota conissans TaxID=109636 RepID=A0A9P6D069_9AGAR|nr:hypothetical protein BDN70DRAFT_879204 [Pholiota conissans]
MIMRSKRNYDEMEYDPNQATPSGSSPKKHTQPAIKAGPRKKARVSDASAAEDATNKGKKNTQSQSWMDIKLPREDEREIPIYDDCNEIRRKIRRLQKTPGFKLNHWLKDIGNINNNSYARFMRYEGETGGASNGTYYAAYVYFEKVRILEGMKKTTTRLANERQHSRTGFSRKLPSRWIWVRDGEPWR